MGNEPTSKSEIVAASNHQVMLPTKEMITNQQIDNLLSIVSNLRWFVEQPGENHPNLAIDGGVHCAAVATAIKVFDRLDAIIDDPSRWNLDGHSKLMDTIQELYQAQIDFSKVQIESSRQVQRPSFKLQPTLVQLGNEYVAFWGDINTPGRHIIGKGATPNAALLDFDQAFERTPDAQIYLVAENPSATPPTPEPEKRRKKK